jgi:hypothetical protein
MRVFKAARRGMEGAAGQPRARPSGRAIFSRPVAPASRSRKRDGFAADASCPAKRGRGTTLRSSVVEGARPRGSPSRGEDPLCRAPLHHASHGPPPPLRGGGKEKRPRGAISARAMEGGEWRNAIRADPTFYSLFAIRYFLIATRSFKEKGGGTPADAIHPLAASADAARPPRHPPPHAGGGKGGGRSPVGVPPRLLLRRTNATAQLRLRASWDAALAGVTRLQPVPVQRAPRRPVIVPAGRIPEAARERIANPPAGTAPAPSSGLPPEGVPE